MGLATYRKKRNFKQTPEPTGIPATGRQHGLHYVVQKHAASHLHYDFRLELDGTLKSWAVPKGPSLDPSRKALAVQVEDHPLAYETFEGIIPKGQYGGGTVMVWDRGTWEPLEDPHDGFKKGKLRFTLHGEKLQGDWSLVRMHGSAGGDGRNWLLMKSKDQYSDSRNILEEAPESVKSQRSMEEISEQRKAVWNSNKRGQRKAAVNGAIAKDGRKLPAGVGVQAEMPTQISPQLAMLSEQPPQGEEWIHEIKFDGYRLLAFLNDGDVNLRTRTNQDWTAKFSALIKPLKGIKARTAILDGEVVVLNPEGKSDFQLLQSSFKSKNNVDLHYFLFDLLYLDGRDLRKVPLLERKALLNELLEASNSPERLNLSDHVRGEGSEVIRKACALGSEGIVSKRIDSLYVSRRDPSWVKSKCTKGQEFVIVGYTPSVKRAEGLKSLLLGYHDPEQGLIYCGRVGTGFDATARKDLLAKLQKLEQEESPTAVPAPAREQAAAHWVKPTLVCEVHFEGWTRDNVLRHPSFKSLRLDKPAKEVTREVPATVRASKGKPAGAAPTATTTKPTKTRSPARSTPSPEGAWGSVQLTHPDKVLYPDQGFTKRNLADYYQVAAPFMLPHVVERPLALMRCPAGLATKCFFMRNWSESLPEAVDKVKVAIGKNESHVMIHDAAGLFSLVQISALEIHTWNCHVDDMIHPDQVVFDLDPGPEVTWKQIVKAARILREVLGTLGLTPFVKTSGGKGLHLTVPIVPTVAWKEVKAFCRTIAEFQAGENELFVANMRKELRHGKIYIDYLRNDQGSTAVAPYSARARAGAAVSMPLAWDEIDSIKSADHLTIKNAGAYLAKRKDDPWAEFDQARVDLHKIVNQAPTKKKEE